MRRSIAIALGLLLAPAPAFAFLEVPGTYATIQQAVDAAGDGDIVLVAPGIYRENVSIAGKAIVLSSQHLIRGDPSLIDQTVIDGGGGSHAIRVASSVGPGTAIRGFTHPQRGRRREGLGPLEFTNNRVTASGDGIDYESGSGGLVRDCIFEDNRDDGIDLDQDVAVVIEHSIIRNNGNDGIEVRLHDYTGPELAIVIRDNRISGNGGDGIQLIDDEAPSSRVFRIERNLIANNAQAAIGMMCCMNTQENFQGASLAERIYLFDNTFVGNDHGVTGGDNAIALNNLFAHNTRDRAQEDEWRLHRGLQPLLRQWKGLRRLQCRCWNHDRRRSTARRRSPPVAAKPGDRRGDRFLRAGLRGGAEPRTERLRGPRPGSGRLRGAGGVEQRLATALWSRRRAGAGPAAVACRPAKDSRTSARVTASTASG